MFSSSDPSVHGAGAGQAEMDYHADTSRWTAFNFMVFGADIKWSPCFQEDRPVPWIGPKSHPSSGRPVFGSIADRRVARPCPAALCAVGMIGLCMFQWPITLYMMVRPDSERDDEESVQVSQNRPKIDLQ